MGHVLLMGRRTFESIGRALPGRKTIVITRNGFLFPPANVTIANSVADALDAARTEDEIFVAGGGEIFAEMLPLADRLYVTVVDVYIDGDTYFPHINSAEWQPVFTERHQPDEKNQYPYTFIDYERVAK